MRANRLNLSDKRKKIAFTLIELMTVLVIMSLIICAAIPFAMKKDIQKRAVAGNVGVFECYYKNGVLWEHIRSKDGTTYRDAAASDQSACSFNPNDDYAKGAKNFQIVAIGGGGAGGRYNNQENDGRFEEAIHTPISNEDTLEDSEHLKLLKAHGRLGFGNLSNAGGVNAWYWNGQTEKTITKVKEAKTKNVCGYVGHCPGGGYGYCDSACASYNSYGDLDVFKGILPYHFAVCPQGGSWVEICRDIVVEAAKSETFVKNDSSTDYISVYDIGPRLCSLKNTDIMTKDLPEDDIFQAVHKYYGVAGSYTNGTSKGDVLYNIKAPSGLASCACLNDPVSTKDGRGSCMAGSIKSSFAGSAGVAYSFATYSGILRGAYMGNSFLTNNGSVDEAGDPKLGNHCATGLKLAKTTFGCGTAKSNNECNDQNIRSGYDRGFPKIYKWGNEYDTSTDPSAWYEEIDMSYTNREGDLSDYGGDVHFRLVTHSGGKGHAIVPSGAHGSNPTIAGGTSKVQTAASSVNSGFKGFINGHQGFYSANNPSSKCSNPINRREATAWDTLYRVKGSCSSECDYTYTCGSETCDGTDTCSAETVWANYWPNKTQQTASVNQNINCHCSCTDTNNETDYTESAATCEHLNCCNDYEPGDKKYTVRYKTGELAHEGSQKIERNFKQREHTLDCGDNLYIYRQIKNVPFERAFVASAGQNGAVRQASYPKIDELLFLHPGKGGKADATYDNVGANGQASVIKKAEGQIVLTAQGGLKGASDKLNDTWVGPCFLFTHRDSLNTQEAIDEYVKRPGCLARENVQRKPIYNSLLMANKDFLHTVDIRNGTSYNYDDMPGLGGDGAYANVFPDRFLLSEAIRNEVLLETNIVGPDQGDPWSKTEGVYRVKGFDAFAYNKQNKKVVEEFLGSGSYAESFKRRYEALEKASNNFLNKSTDGRVPNFTNAKDGNNGAIVIIW